MIAIIIFYSEYIFFLIYWSIKKHKEIILLNCHILINWNDKQSKLNNWLINYYI